MFQRLSRQVDDVSRSVRGRPGQPAERAGLPPTQARGLWRRGWAASARLLGAARRRPKTYAAALTLLLLGGGLAAFYAYAFHEWAAAQSAVKEERIQEAQNSAASGQGGSHRSPLLPPGARGRRSNRRVSANIK